MYGHKLRTMALTGEASLSEREEAFERLEMDSEKSEAGNAREFIMPNTDKQAVEIEWILDTPVREDLYEYIINT